MNKYAKSKFIPLTESTYYILLALVSPKHGYAVMQEAEEISGGTLRLAPGTLYGAFTTLDDGKLIRMVGKEGRRKIFQITEKGTGVLLEQIRRYRIMVQSAENNKEIWKNNPGKEG